MSLEADTYLPPGQLFACLSIVGPDGCNQKNEKYGIKIRGCFGTQEEAAKHAKKLSVDDPTFDVFVVTCGQWLLIPPDTTQIEDVNYNEEKLQELMKGYAENQRLAAKMFEERKRDMQERPDGDYFKAGDENSRFYTKPDEAPVSHPAEILERLKKEKPDAPMEELVREADEIVKAEIEERRKAREANVIVEDAPEEEKKEEPEEEKKEEPEEEKKEE